MNVCFYRKLLASGWTPGRHVDLDEVAGHHEAAGHPLSEAARKFLHSFLDIRIRYDDQHLTDPRDEISFAAVAAAAGVSPPAISYYESRVGTMLTVIGEARRGHLLLLMAPTGAVIGGYDRIITVVGRSGLDAILGLITGRRGVSVTEQQD